MGPLDQFTIVKNSDYTVHCSPANAAAGSPSTAAVIRCQFPQEENESMATISGGCYSSTEEVGTHIYKTHRVSKPLGACLGGIRIQYFGESGDLSLGTL